jgi:hypothetical protein
MGEKIGSDQKGGLIREGHTLVSLYQVHKITSFHTLFKPAHLRRVL